MIPLIIQDQFYTIQNLQRSPIPQTSNWSGTFFAVSYNKPALAIFVSVSLVRKKSERIERKLKTQNPNLGDHWSLLIRVGCLVILTIVHLKSCKSRLFDDGFGLYFFSLIIAVHRCVSLVFLNKGEKLELV